jgi:hypothetical protein
LALNKTIGEFDMKKSVDIEFDLDEFFHCVEDELPKSVNIPCVVERNNALICDNKEYAIAFYQKALESWFDYDGNLVSNVIAWLELKEYF